MHEINREQRFGLPKNDRGTFLQALDQIRRVLIFIRKIVRSSLFAHNTILGIMHDLVYDTVTNCHAILLRVAQAHYLPLVKL